MTMTESLKKFAAATNNELFDAEWKGGEWMVEAVETHETLDQYVDSSNVWAERSGFERGEIAGLPFVAWKSCQAIKGQARRSMSVIDLGDIRIAIETYLPNF